MAKYKSVSVVIPVYNEQNTIQTVIESVSTAIKNIPNYSIIVVNDASTDNTLKVLKKIEKNYTNLHVISLSVNSGKGAALKRGFLETKGDIVIIQDADLEYSPSNYPDLLEPFIASDADVVYGSRLMTNKAHRVMYFWHYQVNMLLTLFSNIFTNLNLTDMETGYKAFRGDIIRAIAPTLTSNRFGFEPEITAKIAHYRVRRLKIFEVGISYNGRTYEEGKKIGWKDGVEALWCIIKFNTFGR